MINKGLIFILALFLSLPQAFAQPPAATTVQIENEPKPSGLIYNFKTYLVKPITKDSLWTYVVGGIAATGTLALSLKTYLRNSQVGKVAQQFLSGKQASRNADRGSASNCYVTYMAIAKQNHDAEKNLRTSLGANDITPVTPTEILPTKLAKPVEASKDENLDREVSENEKLTARFKWLNKLTEEELTKYRETGLAPLNASERNTLKEAGIEDPTNETVASFRIFERLTPEEREQFINDYINSVIHFSNELRAENNKNLEDPYYFQQVFYREMEKRYSRKWTRIEDMFTLSWGIRNSTIYLPNNIISALKIPFGIGKSVLNFPNWISQKIWSKKLYTIKTPGRVQRALDNFKSFKNRVEAKFDYIWVRYITSAFDNRLGNHLNGTRIISERALRAWMILALSKYISDEFQEIDRRDSESTTENAFNFTVDLESKRKEYVDANSELFNSRGVNLLETLPERLKSLEMFIATWNRAPGLGEGLFLESKKITLPALGKHTIEKFEANTHALAQQQHSREVEQILREAATLLNEQRKAELEKEPILLYVLAIKKLIESNIKGNELYKSKFEQNNGYFKGDKADIYLDYLTISFLQTDFELNVTEKQKNSIKLNVNPEIKDPIQSSDPNSKKNNKKDSQNKENDEGF